MRERPDTVSHCPLVHGCPDVICLDDDKLRALLFSLDVHLEVVPAAVWLCRLNVQVEEPSTTVGASSSSGSLCTSNYSWCQLV